MLQDSLHSPVITSGSDKFLPAHSATGVLLGVQWLDVPVPGRMLCWRQQAPQGGTTTKKTEPVFLEYPETRRVPP